MVTESAYTSSQKVIAVVAFFVSSALLIGAFVLILQSGGWWWLLFVVLCVIYILPLGIFLDVLNQEERQELSRSWDLRLVDACKAPEQPYFSRVLDKYYLAGQISKKKAKAAEVNYPLPGRKGVLALLDTSEFGSAKTGLAIGADGISWKNANQPAIQVPWDEFARVDITVQPSKGLFSAGPRVQIGTLGHIEAGGYVMEAETVAKLLRKIQGYARNNRSPWPTARGLTQSTLRRREEDFEKNRQEEIRKAREETKEMILRGAIFTVTSDSSIEGYHLKELGWVSCKAAQRSKAENSLKILAANTFHNANSLTKLTSTSVLVEKSNAAPKDEVSERDDENRFLWEAMACEAIPQSHVDQVRKRADEKMVVVDGSNVAYWGAADRPFLESVAKVVELLKGESARVHVIFDASIGPAIKERSMSVEEVRREIELEGDVEIVESGTDADRRIAELAEKINGVIVSNDFFRDSLRARHVPKRRGFYLPKYKYAEILEPRL